MSKHVIEYYEREDNFDLRSLSDDQVFGLICDAICESAIRVKATAKFVLDSVYASYEPSGARDFETYVAWRASL
jgi:hypothetical protein